MWTGHVLPHVIDTVTKQHYSKTFLVPLRDDDACLWAAAPDLRHGTFLSLRNSDTRLVPRVWIGSLGICFYLGSCRVPEL